MGRYDEILLVSDFDRTLTDLDDMIPQSNLDAIADFIREGGAFTIATGRSLGMFQPRAASVPVNAPCILFNGAYCCDLSTGQELFRRGMTDCAGLVQQLAARYPTLCIEVQNPESHYTVNGVGQRDRMRASGVPVRAVPADEIPQPFLKITVIGPYTPSPEFPDFFCGCTAEEDALYESAAAFIRAESGGRCDPVRSAPRMIEIQASGVSKGAAARALAKSLGRRTLVCVGDSPNDLSMLQAADRAFVPANASPALLRAGFPLAADCGVGAVASVIHAL
ncbi:MAG: HAD hydrolase family protein [Oscillospiraceae bacterium]|nr:HAD hydrolase family protein [Oscillospiraceae bacterium]